MSTCPQTVTFAVALGLTFARTLLQLALAFLPAQMSAQGDGGPPRSSFSCLHRTVWATKAKERDGAFQTLMTQNVTNVAAAVIGLGNGLTATIMFAMMVVVALLQSAVSAGVLATAALALFVASPAVVSSTSRATPSA